MEHQLVGWFEIPVTDMVRAIAFYQTVFGIRLERHQMGPLDMAWFPKGPDESKGAAGSLVQHPDFYRPSLDGVLVYFTSPSGTIDDELNRVVSAGGTILVPRKVISPGYGSMCVITDTEGNRIAIHSRIA